MAKVFWTTVEARYFLSTESFAAAAGFDDDFGVPAGDGEVVDDDGVAIGAADDERREVERILPRVAVRRADRDRTELHAKNSPGARSAG